MEQSAQGQKLGFQIPKIFDSTPVLYGIILFLLAVIVGSSFFGLAMMALNLREYADHYTGDGGGGNYGTISGNVPAPLKEVFTEVGQKVGVPPALLAAFSTRECGRLWQVEEAALADWITNEKNVEPGYEYKGVKYGTDYNRQRLDCGFDNGWKVWGPMQFIYSTWGVANPSDAPAGTPRSGSYGAKAAELVGTAPNMVKLKQAFYAGAQKIKNDSKNQGGSWTEEEIRRAAKAYCGSCDDQTACGGDYCDGIFALYNKYSGQMQ